MDYNKEIFCFTFLLASVVVCRAGNVHLVTSSNAVEEHDQVVLTCSAPGNTVAITWSHDAHTVNVNDTKKFKYEFDTNGANKVGKLTILKMEHENEGNYTCSAGGSSSNVVNIKATHHLHHITSTRTKVSLAEGSSLTLNCQADIHTDVVWFKGPSTPLLHGQSGVTIAVQKDEPNHLLTSTLTIDSADDHSGTYYCQSEHSHHHDHDHDHDDHDHDSHEHEKNDHVHDSHDDVHEDKVVFTVVKGLGDTSSAVTLALQSSSSTSFKAVLFSALLFSLAFAFRA